MSCTYDYENVNVYLVNRYGTTPLELDEQDPPQPTGYSAKEVAIAESKIDNYSFQEDPETCDWLMSAVIACDRSSGSSGGSGVGGSVSSQSLGDFSITFDTANSSQFSGYTRCQDDIYNITGQYPDSVNSGIVVTSATRKGKGCCKC